MFISKVISAFLLFVVVAFVASCGGGSSNNLPGSSPTPSNLGPSVPTISAFSSSATSVSDTAESVTLSWEVSGATSLQLSNISANLPAASGSVVVFPATTTTYTLTATNTVGSTQATVTIDAGQITPLASLQINPSAATQAIAPDFLGIGHNMGDTLALIGTSPTDMNPIYAQLIKNLTQYANGPLLIHRCDGLLQRVVSAEATKTALRK